jgi:hypothetical protein
MPVPIGTGNQRRSPTRRSFDDLMEFRRPIGAESESEVGALVAVSAQHLLALPTQEGDGGARGALACVGNHGGLPPDDRPG